MGKYDRSGLPKMKFGDVISSHGMNKTLKLMTERHKDCNSLGIFSRNQAWTVDYVGLNNNLSS